MNKKIRKIAFEKYKSKTGTKSKKDCDNLCVGCPSICCKDLVSRIGKPANQSEMEDLKWHLHFDTVGVFIKDKRWHLHIKGNCIYLDENELCTIYDRRPKKCRDHMPPGCERYGEGLFYDVFISTPEELDAYFEKEKKRRARRRKKK